MDVSTGEFKDLACCFLLNVNRPGTLAVLASHKLYGLVKLDDDLSQFRTTKRVEHGNNWQNQRIQDIKFGKRQSVNLIAEASTNKINLLDCTNDLQVMKNSEFYAHARDITSIDWNEQNDLLGKMNDLKQSCLFSVLWQHI